MRTPALGRTPAGTVAQTSYPRSPRLLSSGDTSTSNPKIRTARGLRTLRSRSQRFRYPVDRTSGSLPMARKQATREGSRTLMRTPSCLVRANPTPRPAALRLPKMDAYFRNVRAAGANPWTHAE